MSSLHSNMAILSLILTTVLTYGVEGFAVRPQLRSASTFRTSLSAAAVALGPNNTTSGISSANSNVVAPRPSMSESMEAASLMMEKEAMAEALEAAYVASSSSDEGIVVEPPTTATLIKPVHSFASMWDCLEFLQHVEDDNHQDEQQQLFEDESNQIEQQQQEFYVVKYYAQYCKVCQRAAINYKKISLEHARSRVHFLRADAGSWATGGYLQELKDLGVSKFPFVQVYNGQGQCVASFSTGAAHLFTNRVRDTLDMILQRTPLEWQAFEQEFGHEIVHNQVVRRDLLQGYQQQQQDEGSIEPCQQPVRNRPARP